MGWIKALVLILKITRDLIKYRTDPERAEKEAMDDLLTYGDEVISDANKGWQERSTEQLAEVIARHDSVRTRRRMQSDTDEES